MSKIKNVLLDTLNRHLQRDYKKVAKITYYPPSRGHIAEDSRYGMLAMRANSNGLFFLVDGKGNARVSKNLYMNNQESKRPFILALSEWEKRTGNVI